MKKTLIMGSVLAGFLLLMLPCISAGAAHTVEEPTISSLLQELLQKILTLRLAPTTVLLFLVTLVGIVVGNPSMNIQYLIPNSQIETPG